MQEEINFCEKPKTNFSYSSTISNKDELDELKKKYDKIKGELEQ